jgi:hypothetical protein
MTKPGGKLSDGKNERIVPGLAIPIPVAQSNAALSMDSYEITKASVQLIGLAPAAVASYWGALGLIFVPKLTLIKRPSSKAMRP